ncbi:hypothetical protein ABT112_27205 [Streptomyces sp. NPDC002055]|uniref:hypothetical protein n=1 Tax=Streptomyces sp. NPDC002055 TaxID=3154534 RepID=UPI003328E4FF
MTTLQHSAHVSVHLTDCAPEDADLVFDALRAAFPAPMDREAEEHCVKSHTRANPMVWIGTFDVRRHGEPGPPPALRGAVTADLFGSERAVHDIVESLGRAFGVTEEGHTVPGDQEVQLRLELRGTTRPEPHTVAG